MDAQTRPQLLAKPRRRGFARAPTAIIFFVIRRPERTDRREKSRFLRFYLASDSQTDLGLSQSRISRLERGTAHLTHADVDVLVKVLPSLSILTNRRADRVVDGRWRPDVSA